MQTRRSVLINQHTALINARDGAFLINRNDIYVGRAIERYGEYSQIELELLQRLTGKGDFVVEVGANIGSHTVAFAKAIGPSGVVVAIEPQLHCLHLLHAQLALNGLNNVAVMNVGAGASKGRMWHPRQSYQTEGNFGGVALSASPEGVPVQIVRLDDHLAGQKIRLMKIDVEGMEAEVIAGARAIIESSKPILYVENDRREKSKALITAIRALGYRLWWHLPPLFNPDNFFKEPKNVYGNIVSANMLCSVDKLDVADGLMEILSSDQPHPIFG